MNEDYNKILMHFGNAKAVSQHFDIAVQSVYEWRVKGVPDYRMRELELLKRLEGAECQQTT